MELREYQIECINSIKLGMQKNHRRMLVSLPTGSGKTIIFAHLIKELSLKALIIAPRLELLEQAKQKLQMVCPKLSIGIINADNKEFSTDVVISSIQSLYNENNLLQVISQQFNLIIFDEAQYSGADKAREVLKCLMDRNKEAILVGFTATAYRQGSRGLAPVFDTIAYELDTKTLVERGYLVKPTSYKIMNNLNLTAVTKADDGDFSAESLADVMDTPQMNQLVVQAYLKHGDNRKAIVFGCNIKHALNLYEAFKADDINVAVVHSKMGKERSEIIADFRENKTQVMVNCGILSVGYDDPEVSCAILARPTKSLGLFVQMCGRILRPAPWAGKKDAILLDFNDVNHPSLPLQY